MLLFLKAGFPNVTVLAVLELTRLVLNPKILLSASQVLGLEECANTTLLNYCFKNTLLLCF